MATQIPDDVKESQLRFMRITDRDKIKSRNYQYRQSLIAKAAYAHLTTGTHVALLFCPPSGNFSCYSTTGKFTEMIEEFAELQMKCGDAGSPQLELSILELHDLFHNKADGMSFIIENAVRLKAMGVPQPVVESTLAAFARKLSARQSDDNDETMRDASSSSSSSDTSSNVSLTPAQMFHDKITTACQEFINACPPANPYEPDNRESEDYYSSLSQYTDSSSSEDEDEDPLNFGRAIPTSPDVAVEEAVTGERAGASTSSSSSSSSAPAPSNPAPPPSVPFTAPAGLSEEQWTVSLCAACRASMRRA